MGMGLKCNGGDEVMLFDDEISVESPNDEVGSKRVKCKTSMMVVTVEPVIFLSSVIMGMYSMLAKEYIYQQLAIKHGLVGNHSHKYCGSDGPSDYNATTEAKVSAETSEWTMYCNVAGFLAATFSTMMLGSWSDVIGRKIPLLISSTGLLCLVGTYNLVVNLALPLPVLIGGHVICGLSGDFSTILTCSYSHLSDISTQKRRTFRIAVAEACIGFGMTLANLTGGFWVSARGFKEPFIFLLVLAVVNIIYVAFRMTSRMTGGLRKNMRYLLKLESFRHMWGVVKWNRDGNRRHVSIALYTICFFIVVAVLIGCRSVLVVYEMASPFCWSYSKVGLSLALSESGYFVSLVLLKIFRGATSELRLMVAGIISNVASYTLLSLATMSWHLFLGVGLQVGTYVVAPILRSQISRIVSRDETGAIFALLACAQNVASVAAALVFNGIYVATVTTILPGAAFLLGTALYLLLAALYCSAFHSSKRWLHYTERDQTYTTVTNEE